MNAQKVGAVPAAARKPQSRFLSALRYINRYKFIYLLLLPGVIYFALFHYAPMYFLQVAFKDYNIFLGLAESKWVGLTNFVKLFQTKFFVQAFNNTVILSFMYKLFGFPIPILLAILLNELRFQRFKKSVQTFIYMPHFFSWVIVGGIFITLLQPNGGLINEFLSLLGIKPIAFITSKAWFRWVLLFTHIWKESGWGTIIYLAAISGISPDLYEAAIIDGAGRFKNMWYVTLPSILPTITVVFVLSLAKVFNLFEQVFVMYNPLVSAVSETIDTYVYQQGIVRADIAFATTAGLFKNIITVILIVITNKIVEKLQGESVI